MQIPLLGSKEQRTYTLDTDHSPSEGEALWCCEVAPNGGIDMRWVYVKLGSDILGKPPGPIVSLMTKRKDGFRYLDAWITENLDLVELLLTNLGHKIDTRYQRTPPANEPHIYKAAWKAGGS